MASKLPLAVTDLQIIATSSLTRPLSAPVLTASAIGTTSAVLSWTAPIPTGISIIAGYRLKRAPLVSGPYTTVFTSLALTFADTFADETWFYTIEAFDQFTTGIVSAPLTVQPSTTLPLFTQATVAANGETKPGSVIYQPPNALTVACWVQVPSAVTNYPAFVSYGQDTTPFESYILQAQTIDSAHPADFFFLTGTGQPHQLFGATSLVPGTLYFIVGTYDGTTACLYVNGQLERSASDTGALYYPGGGLGLGRKFTDVSANFTGSVTNVAIYATALTATQILAQYQAVVGVPTFGPAQPTAAFIGIAGAQTYTDATQQASMGYYDLFVMGGPWEGWSSSGRNKDTIVKAVKAASTALSGTLVFNYQNLNAVDTTTNDAYPTFSAEMTTRNWKLYNSGSSGTLTPANSGASTTYLVNYTTFVPTNPTGEYPYDFGAKYSYYKFLTTTKSDTRFAGLASGLASPTLDGVFQDNFVFNPQVNGDWNRDGVSDAPGWPCAATPWLQTGQLKYCTTMRALAPLKFLFANIGDYGVTDAGVMKGVLDGGLCESYFGKTWSWETQSDFPTVLSYYYKVLDSVRNPSLVVLGGSWPDTNTDGSALVRLPTAGGYPPVNTQWQWARYIHGVARLGDGMPGINRFSQAYSSDLAALDRYDEYGGISGLSRGWLGKPLTSTLGQRTATPRIAKGPVGIYVREYDNGIVAVNPKGNGTQTLTNTDIPGTLKFILGTQDAVRNSGAIFSSISLPERDALFLQRYTQVAATPLRILHTDFTNGAIAGMNTENNLGCFISVFVYAPGLQFSDLGVTKHVKIGSQEVANYRCVDNAVGTGTYGASVSGPGNGVFETFGTQRIVVQVGLSGATLGVALPIDIVDSSGHSLCVNSKDVNGFNLDLDSLQISFTPVNGRQIFASQSGVDQASGPPSAIQGTITAPLRHVQSWNASTSTFGGAAYGPTGTGSPTTSNQIPPGTQVVMRGGEWGADQSWQTSFCDFFRKSGTPPSAAAQSGSITFTSYPGAAGANAPERVTINTLAASAGGFNFADTARSTESTIYGTVGWSHYIDIANLLIHGPTSSFSTNGAAGCPVNWQTQALGSRVVNCDLSFKPTAGGPTSGGMGGYATLGRRLGNWVHDVADPSGAQQNHGFYIGENTGAAQTFAMGEINSITAYNVMNRVHGGQGIMMRGAEQTETAPYCTIHHNWIQEHGKFAIELFDDRDHGVVWCNVTKGAIFSDVSSSGSQAGIVIGSDNVTVAGAIYVGFNDIIGPWAHYAGLYVLGGSNTGSVKFQGNIVAQESGGSAPFGSGLYYNSGGLAVSLDTSYWFDTTGGDTAKPSGDSAGAFVDPQFANLASLDLHPSATSTVPNKGPVSSVTLPAVDFFFQPRPQGSNAKWSIGAIERIGG